MPDLNERLTQLSEILVALSGTPIPSHQFQILADYTGLVIAHDFMALCLVDPDEQGYLAHVLGGEAMVAPRLFGMGEGSVGRVLRSGRNLLLPHLADYPHAVPDLEGLLLAQGLQSGMVVALRQGERKIGALLFASQRPAGYGERELQMAGLLAAGLSAALETSRLYQILADERGMLTALVQSVQDGILVVNPAGIILLVNLAARQMFQLPNGDMTGQPLANIAQFQPLLALFAQAKALTHELELADGRMIQSNLTQVFTPYDELVGWAAILHDITLFKQLEQTKNDFISTVSHDLKNPITRFLLSAQLLDRFGPLNEKQVEIRKRLIDTANYMDLLVSDLLDLSKIEAGLRLTVAQFDLVAMSGRVLENSRPEAEAKTIALLTQIPPTLPIVGDEARLEQVLHNLLGNGLKYTPAGGQVILTIVLTPDEQVLISVRDTGLGIPAGDLPHIFEKFYRVRNQATKNIAGTGLGLAIVKRIVQAHNGQITVDSQEGQGSTFRVVMPQNLSS